MSTESSFDSLIVGGGHNGLCAAGYLAAAGQRVCVLERHTQLGGACISEELHPGFTVSTASYVVSLLADEVVRDLELARHGYEVLARQPSSFTPWSQGQSLLLGADQDENQRQIAAISRADAEAWPKYEAWLGRVAEQLETLLEGPAPALLPLPAQWRARSFGAQIKDLIAAWRLRGQLKALGNELPEAMELLLGAARPMLERWFESEILRATLASDAIIGAHAPPSAAGTGYVLLHHVMGRAGGARGVWGYVRGGMGGITRAMATTARERGAVLHTGAEVSRVLQSGGVVQGVELTDGRRFSARRVLINATPAVADRLLAAGELPVPYRQALDRIDYRSASAKVNLALAGAPRFRVAPHEGHAGPMHRGTIHICPDLTGIEQGWAEAMGGRFSTRPVIEMTLPSAVDDSLAPPGAHVAQLFVQYVPYGLSRANSDARKQLLAACVSAVEAHAPGFGDLVSASQVLLPEDLESRFGLTGGNIFHGAMNLHQLFSLRPVPGWADHRTPIRGLYLCGAGCHPGGGVSGLPGRHAAAAVLADG